MPNTIRVDDYFSEINTKSLDSRHRITLGKDFLDSKRVKIYKNKRGVILLVPLAEIPESELWLYDNKEAFKDLKKGIEQAQIGKISKLNLDEL